MGLYIGACDECGKGSSRINHLVTPRSVYYLLRFLFILYVLYEGMMIFAVLIAAGSETEGGIKISINSSFG